MKTLLTMIVVCLTLLMSVCLPGCTHRLRSKVVVMEGSMRYDLQAWYSPHDSLYQYRVEPPDSIKPYVIMPCNRNGLVRSASTVLALEFRRFNYGSTARPYFFELFIDVPDSLLEDRHNHIALEQQPCPIYSNGILGMADLYTELCGTIDVHRRWLRPWRVEWNIKAIDEDIDTTYVPAFTSKVRRMSWLKRREVTRQHEFLQI